MAPKKRSSTPKRAKSASTARTDSVEPLTRAPAPAAAVTTKKPSSGGFFNYFWPAEDRCYSRETTAMLTDFAGLAVILFLTTYTVLAGLGVYKELQV
jgi:hypothetical protein